MKNKKISKKSSIKKLNSNNIVLYLTLALSISTLVLAVVLFITRASSKTPETYLMRASKESFESDYCGDGICSSYERYNCICEKDCGQDCTPIPTPTPPAPPTPTPPSINPPNDPPVPPTPTSKPTPTPTPRPPTPTPTPTPTPKPPSGCGDGTCSLLERLNPCSCLSDCKKYCKTIPIPSVYPDPVQAQ